MFCDDCTTKRYELPPSFKLKGKQRVCDDCYYLLVRVRGVSVSNNSNRWTRTQTSFLPAQVRSLSMIMAKFKDVAVLKTGITELVGKALRFVW